MDDVTNVANWRNLVVIVAVDDWISVLTRIWKMTKKYAPRYYEVRCSMNQDNMRYMGLDFRFFSLETIDRHIHQIMDDIGISEQFYDIDPKLRSDEKAKLFAKCSGSYKNVTKDTTHTSGFLTFLTRVADLATDFLSNLPDMTSENPRSQEARNEVSHLFRIMMGIQDGLDWDTVLDREVFYPPALRMLERSARFSFDKVETE